MAQLWRTLLRSLVLGVLFGHPARAAPDEVVSRETLDQYFAAQVRAQRLPGLAVAVMREGKVVLLKGYGGSGAPITPDSQFLVASVSKSFTALAVWQLARRGRIDLDQPVLGYLPEFQVANAATTSSLTVRQLLNQRSGLADAGFHESNLEPPKSLEARVAALKAARPVAPPGVAFHYFNPNYAVLARLVEVVGDQPFDTYLGERVFEPLEMRDSFAALTTRQVRDRATNLAPGHLLAFGVPIRVAERDGFLGGDAGVVTTARDMAKYLAAQLGVGAHALDAATLEALHTPPVGGTYAFGWYTSSEQGTPTVEHNGILGTFAAEVVLLPGTRSGAVLLYNISGLAPTAVTFPALRAGVVALLTGRAPTTPAVALPALGAWIGVLGIGLLAFPVLRWVRWERWLAVSSRVGVWRSTLGIAVSFLPSVLLWWLPWLGVSFSGRYYAWTDLFRAAPDLVAALILYATLCASHGLWRIWVVLRRRVLRPA